MMDMDMKRLDDAGPVASPVTAMRRGNSDRQRHATFILSLCIASAIHGGLIYLGWRIMTVAERPSASIRGGNGGSFGKRTFARLDGVAIAGKLQEVEIPAVPPSATPEINFDHATPSDPVGFEKSRDRLEALPAFAEVMETKLAFLDADDGRGPRAPGVKIAADSETSGISGPPTAQSGNEPPHYPREALRKRLEGTVLLSVQVGADGSVLRVGVAQSSGHAILDDAAIEAVQRWRFSPALLRGVPAASKITQAINFVFRD